MIAKDLPPRLSDPATFMPVAFDGTLMFRVRDGKCVEAWNNFDFFKMFQQMGVVTVKGG